MDQNLMLLNLLMVSVPDENLENLVQQVNLFAFLLHQLFLVGVLYQQQLLSLFYYYDGFHQILFVIPAL